MSKIYYRQDDPIAIHYLKASEQLFKRERSIKYFQIFMSVIFFLAGVFFKFLPDFFDFVNDKTLQKILNISNKYLIFASGIYLVSAIFLGKAAQKLHLEGVTLLERYDNFVFNLPTNETILRNVSDLSINNLASKYGKKSHKLLKYYYKTEYPTDSKTVIFDRYQGIYQDNYNLLCKITPFYNFIWFGFIFLTLGLAVIINKSFVESLSSILVPSLSAIGLIFNSWYQMNDDKQFLQKVIKNLKEIEIEYLKCGSSLNSPLLLRSLQDGLHAYRVRSFTIPVFLVKSYKKSTLKSTIRSQDIEAIQERQYYENIIVSKSSAALAVEQPVSPKKVAAPKTSSLPQPSPSAKSKVKKVVSVSKDKADDNKKVKKSTNPTTTVKSGKASTKEIVKKSK